MLLILVVSDTQSDSIQCLNFAILYKKMNLFLSSWFSTSSGKLDKDCIEATEKDNGLSESDSELLLPALMIKMMLVIMIMIIVVI